MVPASTSKAFTHKVVCTHRDACTWSGGCSFNSVRKFCRCYYQNFHPGSGFCRLTLLCSCTEKKKKTFHITYPPCNFVTKEKVVLAEKSGNVLGLLCHAFTGAVSALGLFCQWPESKHFSFKVFNCILGTIVFPKKCTTKLDSE